MPFSRPLPANYNLDHEYQTIEKITITEGRMNGGIVKVRSRKDGKKYIEKRFTQQLIREGIAKKEIGILRLLRHVNVSKYIDAFIEEKPTLRASLYLELCEWGSLDDTLEKHHQQGRGLGEGFAWSAFLQLANALGYIQYGIMEAVLGTPPQPHWQKIIHRDLQPRNVFLKYWPDNLEGYPMVILGDFGCAQMVDPYHEIVSGNYLYSDNYWAPPESPAFGSPSDIWQMGGIIQSIVRLDGPAARYGPLQGGSRQYRPTGNAYSRQLNEAIRAAMATDWRRRPNIRTLAPFIFKCVNEIRAPRYEFPPWAFQRY